VKAALANVPNVKTTPSSQTPKQQLPNARNKAYAVQGNISMVHLSHPKVFAWNVRKPIFNLQILVGCCTASRTGFALHTITFWVPLYSTMGTALLMAVLILLGPPAPRPMLVGYAKLGFQ
jgi:hypothetical protein